jgi:hypothetical protein
MTTDPTRPTRAEIAEQVRVVRAAQDDVDALLAAAPSAPADQAIARYRSAWLSARQRAAVLCAEVTRRAPLLGEYAAENTRLHQWHDEDRTALTEMRATIERLRMERDSFRDQRNAVFATNEQLHAQVLESDQARLRAENDARTAKREAAPSAPADQNLRDRIRRAICEASGFTWLPDELMEPDEYGEHADAVLAVLPAGATADIRKLVKRLVAHAKGFQDVLDEGDGGAWGRTVGADIEELRAAVVDRPALVDEVPPLLAEVWTVWCEDESAWGYFATEDAGKTGTIDYYEEQEERCPDYGWRQDEERLELLAGGETTGIYLSRHPVYGKPADVSRAAVLREAADDLEAWEPEPSERWTEAERNRYEDGIDAAADHLRRKAEEVEAQQAVADHPASTAPAGDPDCERCEGTGLDPDSYFRHGDTWTHAPCTGCRPEEDETAVRRMADEAPQAGEGR